MYDFDYLKVATVAEAAAALSRDGAMALSGGQTLTPTLKQRLAQPDVLVDLTGVAEMHGVCAQENGLRIGGAVTHGAVAADETVRRTIPALAELAGRIGDPQVRNRGTLGGSLGNNDPSACYPAAALALDAVIETDRREIPASVFFSGLYETALEEGEIVVAARFLRPDSAAWRKFIQPASRFALVGVFVARFGAEARVTVTGAGEEGVFRHVGLETALSQEFTPSAVDPVSVSSNGLIEDLHAGPDYRAHLIKVMTRRAVKDCIDAV